MAQDEMSQEKLHLSSFPLVPPQLPKLLTSSLAEEKCDTHTDTEKCDQKNI